MEREELTEKFSSLQIGVFNASMDAAIKQAKMFVGELIPAEKKAVVEALEKMKLEMPKRDRR